MVRKKPVQSQTSPWEWGAAAFGAAILVFAIGYMAWYGLTHTSGPPVIVVERAESVALDGIYVVKVLVRNEGRSTAAAVEIEGSLMDGEKPVETSGATLDYVPENSEREAYLQFTRDPAKFDLTLRAVGANSP